MKKIIVFTLLTTSFLYVFSQQKTNKEVLKAEIYATEKAFEKMVAEKGVTEAFYFFADEDAVILRANDSIIKGRDNIKKFYNKKTKNGNVKWTADFIDVSDDGTLGYTYGKYVWKTRKENGTISESKGVFHTVWKRQTDKTWKYVWD